LFRLSTSLGFRVSSTGIALRSCFDCLHSIQCHLPSTLDSVSPTGMALSVCACIPPLFFGICFPESKFVERRAIIPTCATASMEMTRTSSCFPSLRTSRTLHFFARRQSTGRRGAGRGRISSRQRSVLRISVWAKIHSSHTCKVLPTYCCVRGGWGGGIRGWGERFHRLAFV
jgi:hypothetical protein